MLGPVWNDATPDQGLLSQGRSFADQASESTGEQEQFNVVMTVPAADCTDPPTGTAPKRTRRRRRHRKSRVAEVSPSKSLEAKRQHDMPMTKADLYFCLRCSLVLVGRHGTDHAVGRVTIVNWDYQVVLDYFVKVPLHVADFRTEITGISPNDLGGPNAVCFDRVRSEVGKLIKGKILIGHGLKGDLSALGLSHPWCDMRDTATYSPFMTRAARRLKTQELSVLAQITLGRSVFGGPVAEAVACIELYKLVRPEWEADIINVLRQKEQQRQAIPSRTDSNFAIKCGTSPLRVNRGANRAGHADVASGHHVLLPPDGGKSRQDVRLAPEYSSLPFPTNYVATQMYRWSNDDPLDGTLYNVSQDIGFRNQNFGPAIGVPQTLRTQVSPQDTPSIAWNCSLNDRMDMNNTRTSPHPQSAGIWNLPPARQDSYPHTDWSTLPSVVDMALPRELAMLNDEDLRQHLPSELIADLDDINRSFHSTTPISKSRHLLQAERKQSWLHCLQK